VHIALVCPDLHGHLNPMTTLGGELARRGHRVRLISSPMGKAAADRAGLGFLPVGVAEHESGDTARKLARLAESRGFAALRQTVELLRGQAAEFFRDAPDLLRGADAVVVDQVSPAGSAVAEALRLPYVKACNALLVLQEAGVPPAVTPWPYRPGPLGRLRNRLGNLLLVTAARPLAAEVNDYRSRNGLPPYRVNDAVGPELAWVAQQPAFFDFPRGELAPHFHYTGPWHATGRDADVPFPWDRLDGRPLVYASLGTLQNRLRHVFAAILEGCAGLDVQVVMSLGTPGGAWDGPMPANAVVVPFAPQLRLLDRAALLVTHAGLNTALEGLARGLPMLCLPVTNDQPGVARRVEWLGAGEMLAPSRATADRVRAAVTRLLGEPKYRAAAVGCRDKLKAGPGVARAADVIERAFETRTRQERAAEGGK